MTEEKNKNISYIKEFDISPCFPNIRELEQRSLQEQDWLQEPSTKTIMRKDDIKRAFWYLLLTVGIFIGLLVFIHVTRSDTKTLVSPFHLFPKIFGAFLVGIVFFGLAVTIHYVARAFVVPRCDSAEQTVKIFFEELLTDHYVRAWGCLGSNARREFPSHQYLSDYWRKVKKILKQQTRWHAMNIAPEFSLEVSDYYLIKTGPIEKHESSNSAAIVAASLIVEPGFHEVKLSEKLVGLGGKIKIVFHLSFGVLRGGNKWYLHEGSVDLSILPSYSDLQEQSWIPSLDKEGEKLIAQSEFKKITKFLIVTHEAWRRGKLSHLIRWRAEEANNFNVEDFVKTYQKKIGETIKAAIQKRDFSESEYLVAPSIDSSYLMTNKMLYVFNQNTPTGPITLISLSEIEYYRKKSGWSQVSLIIELRSGEKLEIDGLCSGPEGEWINAFKP